MDRRDLVEGLQKAFNDDSRVRNTDDIHDVEYKENTNTLYVKEQKTYNIVRKKEEEPGFMSEEEIFKRLQEQRR